MIKIAICDDNSQECALLQNYIDSYINEHNIECMVYTYSCGEVLYKGFEEIHFDIIFLDIYMENILGTELARKIREKSETTLIIFTTSSSDHAIEGYSFRIFNYLIKPIEEVEIKQVLKDAIRHLMLRKQVEYIFPTQDGVRKILLDHLYYIESNVRKTIIHFENEQFLCTYNINTLEEKLGTKGFVRCHRSFIVNLNQIEIIKGAEIILKNGTCVYLSKYKQKEVKKKLIDYCGGDI